MSLLLTTISYKSTSHHEGHEVTRRNARTNELVILVVIIAVSISMHIDKLRARSLHIFWYPSLSFFVFLRVLRAFVVRFSSN